MAETSLSKITKRTNIDKLLGKSLFRKELKKEYPNGASRMVFLWPFDFLLACHWGSCCPSPVNPKHCSSFCFLGGKIIIFQKRALLENWKKAKLKRKCQRPKVNLFVVHLFLTNQLQIVMTGLVSQDPGILVSVLNSFTCVLFKTLIS